jgi:hypothetical protein
MSETNGQLEFDPQLLKRRQTLQWLLAETDWHMGLLPAHKLIVGVPLYHSLPAPFFIRWTHLNMRAVAGTVTVNGAYISTACEVMVSEALTAGGYHVPDCPKQGGPIHKLDAPRATPKITWEGLSQPGPVPWDWFVVIEHDVLPPTDVFDRIASYDPHKTPIIGAMVFEHNPPHPAMVFVENDGAFDPITPATVKAWTDAPGLYRCDATSFSLIAIARHVLSDWPEGSDAAPMFGLAHQVGSHDIWFCREARKRHPIHVDSGVVCVHGTPNWPIGLEDNQRCAHMVDETQVRDFKFAETI